MMARLMAAAAALGSIGRKLPFLPGLDSTPTGRERTRKNHGLHKQAIGGWRPSKSAERWKRPHQGERECARRVRQMARNAGHVAAEGRP